MLPFESGLLTMQVGSSYYARVRALNAAGLEGFEDSQPIKIEEQSRSLPPEKVAGIVLGAVFGTGILVAALTIYLTRSWCVPHACYRKGSCALHCLFPPSYNIAWKAEKGQSGERTKRGQRAKVADNQIPCIP